MSEIGYIFIDACDAVCFKANNITVSVKALDPLEEIYSVVHATKGGYIVLNTNYGEEFYYLKEILQFLGVYDKQKYDKNVKVIKKWVIKNGKRPKIIFG